MKRENPWYYNAFSLIQILTYCKQEGGGKKKMMGGWKTNTAGIGSIIWGITGFVVGIHDATVMMQFVLGGLSVLGIGHKIEKTSEKK